MNLFADAIRFLFDPASYIGNKSIALRLVEHLDYTGISMLLALAIAIPLGLLVGHTGKGRNLAVTVTSAARSLPSLGLLFFFVLLFGLGLFPLIIALVLLAIPPILAGAYAGLEAVSRDTIDAARAIGMTEWQVLVRVEVPLAAPLILGGIRGAVLQVISTATIAGFAALGGLGRFLVEGLAVHDYTLVLAGAILVAVLALLVDGVLALIQRFAVPPGVSGGAAGTTHRTTGRPRRRLRVAGTPTQGRITAS